MIFKKLNLRGDVMSWEILKFLIICGVIFSCVDRICECIESRKDK